MDIVCMGCVQALFDSLARAGVSGSHCGGGRLVVKAEGKNGSCMVQVLYCNSRREIACHGCIKAFSTQ